MSILAKRPERFSSAPGIGQQSREPRVARPIPRGSALRAVPLGLGADHGRGSLTIADSRTWGGAFGHLAGLRVLPCPAG
eukprot:4404846-Alexandrium_andersonii.AAC.1